MAFDLDDDELRATRILHGVDKKNKRISEEQAIKELTEIKELVEEDLKYKDYEVTATLDQIDLESLVIVLNLIEKQQKEIEHWKAGMKIIEKDKNNHIERLERKIEELDSQNEVLEEIKTSYEKKTDKLLKEKVKKEKEIEELKDIAETLRKENVNLYIERRQNENKIKAKIEELEREKEKYFEKQVIQHEIEVLQSLLEKE